MNAHIQPVSLADPLGSMLAARWAWTESKLPSVQRAFAELNKLAKGERELRQEFQAQKDAGRLSESGLKEHMLEYFKKVFAPAYRDADYNGRRGIERAIETIRAQGVHKIDPTDAASAILRSDLRRAWAEMADTAKMAMIQNPSPLMATALLELPPEFHGLTEEQESTMRECAFGHAFPDHARDIHELGEVLGFVKSGLQIAFDAAQRNVPISGSELQSEIWGGTPGNEV